ncbi:HDOD domain-containing protein [Undibacterium curvum]|uniref:HDOD domain-containing protein n=1 Tax=Undibacterium curvum TaxID=2762294 RepID=UPI003D09A0D6
MSAISAEQLVRALEELPSLPQVLSELIEAIEHDNVDQRSIIMRIAQDQALTSKTLRLANSSFYGLSYRVNSLSDAVSILGFRSLRTLVTSTAIANLLHRFVLERNDVDYFLEHSISVAIFAKLLAAHICANQEQAFTTGLIHDLGKLALVTKFPAEYAAVKRYQKEQDCARYAAENAVLSMSHASIGAMLARRWRFPLEMQQAVSAHHDPVTAETSELAMLMTVANIFAKVRVSDEERIHLLRESSYAWQRLELNEELCLRIFATEKQQYAEISQILLCH